MKNPIYLLILMISVVNIVMAQKIVPVPVADHPVYFDVSPPLRDMLAIQPMKYDGSWKVAEVKNYFNIRRDEIQQQNSPLTDPGLQDHDGWLPSDTTIQNFEGMGNVSGYIPPDTHGDVGLNDFFQVVNCSYSVFNKSGGKILGPLASSSVWSGMPNNANSGDAIVLYDEEANRWLFSQFSLPNGSGTAPFYQMIAVSQTPDPTGSWYRYEYVFSSMPDYPKFGVWPDAYYMSANLFSGGWSGNGAYCYNRASMIAGNPDAVRISFTLSPGSDGFISLLPSDCDGTFPAMGTPNYFTFIRTSTTQKLGIYEFHADFETPANSTFGNKIYLTVNPFTLNGDAGNGIPQLGSNKKLETLSDRLMYRQQFRTFNGYSSMVLNHTVDGTASKAGIRWYELRNTGTGWNIYQQATYSPADNNSRWMGSIAQDTAGTIAMGYSVSGASIYPAIRYTGRLKTDPLNQMSITERTIINGGGSQTGIWSGRSRWGDYSTISVDPAAPTTFWYSTEYYGTTSSSNWQTRIASFTFANVFSSAASATPSMICTSTTDSSQLNSYGYGGSGIYTYSWISIPAGFTSTIKNPMVRPVQNTTYVVAVSDGSQTRHDTVDVRIVAGPTANAGNDTTVCWFISPILIEGMATNYSKIAWGTAGDGSFTSLNSLITYYLPGIHDKTSGSVDLVLLVLPIAPCSDNATSIKHIVLDPCTGIAESPGNEQTLSVHPNPVHSKALITMNGLHGITFLTISGIEGGTIYNTAIDPAGKQSLTKELDLSQYPNGVYILKMVNNDRITSVRFIVQ